MNFFACDTSVQKRLCGGEPLQREAPCISTNRMTRNVTIRIGAALLLAGLVIECAASIRRDATSAGRATRGGYEESESVSRASDGVRTGRERRSREERTGEEPATDAVPKEGQTTTKRVVLYSGQLVLETPAVEGAITSVEETVRRLGGHVQSSQGGRPGQPATVVVRVPAERFDEAMSALAAIGRVQDRRIQARDVTREFADLQRALALHLRTRERLDQLLRRTASTSERIKILREIRRLSEEIERMKAQEKDIQSRAQFAVITVRLVPLRPENLGAFAGSPFPWLVRLHPNVSLLKPESLDFTMTRPAGFFDYGDDFRSGRRPHLFLSPSGTRIRALRVLNEPRTTKEFWERAVTIEMDRRGYQRVKDVTAGAMPGPFFCYRLEVDGNELVYAFVVMVQGRHVYVADAVFPSQALFREEGPKAFAALASFRPAQPGVYERMMIWLGF